MKAELEHALNATIGEFGGRLARNPSLRRNIEADYSQGIPPEMRVGNSFDVQAGLAQRLRRAYESGMVESFASIPIWMGEIGANSITYKYGSYPYQPFSNETTGENISWVRNIFGKISRTGRQTEFYRYLCSLIYKFESGRNSLRDEIIGSHFYVVAKQSIISSAAQSPESDISRSLREKYRLEELKRKNWAIDLTIQAEEIFGLASRLLEGLRHYAVEVMATKPYQTSPQLSLFPKQE